MTLHKAMYSHALQVVITRFGGEDLPKGFAELSQEAKGQWYSENVSNEYACLDTDQLTRLLEGLAEDIVRNHDSMVMVASDMSGEVEEGYVYVTYSRDIACSAKRYSQYAFIEKDWLKAISDNNGDQEAAFYELQNAEGSIHLHLEDDVKEVHESFDPEIDC